MIEFSGGCLVGTSANKSGARSPITAAEVMESLGEELDLLIDGGVTLLGKESTVVDTTINKGKILREGAIERRKILKVLES